METTACTINLKFYLSVIGGHLCKQAIFKIHVNENSIFRVGVLSVLFPFSLLKEIPNLSHPELMRFQEEKR